jgi:class 3 adenylate cyclase
MACGWHAVQDLGDRYGAVRDEHAAILRRAIRDGGGVEVSTEGDSFFAAFASPVGAVRAAVDAQRSTLQPATTNERPLSGSAYRREVVGQVFVSNVGGSWPYGWNRSAVSCGTYVT